MIRLFRHIFVSEVNNSRKGGPLGDMQKVISFGDIIQQIR